ncbi:MAG: radical SAM protein [Verrucomicrobiota bacterium]|nr:radical SAM protein [Verrucomicrobiota bacterium]
MNYKEPLFRPPAEGNSLIFQIAYGCPHNTCEFCPMYKKVRYSQRSLREVLQEIERAAKSYSDEKRIFLADADIMFLPFNELEIILEKINKSFPKVARINMYANGNSILSKNSEELSRLKVLKVKTLYMGLETGDDNLLRKVHKSERSVDMIKAVHLAQNCGLRTSVMVLLGLGGRNGSESHTKKTISVLNKMQPRLLSMLRFIEVKETKIYKDYHPQTEYEVVEELKNMLAGLKLNKTVFTANHSSNPLPLKGRLPYDKQKLMETVKHILDSNLLNKKGVGNLPYQL